MTKFTIIRKRQRKQIDTKSKVFPTNIRLSLRAIRIALYLDVFIKVDQMKLRLWP